MIRVPGRAKASLVVVILCGAVALVGLPWSGRTPPDRSGSVERPPPDPAVGVDVAARTVDRLQLFRTGNHGERLSLTAQEVTAVLRHALPGILPEGVMDPTVRLVGGEVLVDARLAPHELAGVASLETALGVVPNTVEIALRGRLGRSPRHLVFEVERAWAAGVPLPRGVVSTIAAALSERSGRTPSWRDGEAPAFTLRWPEGVSAVVVVGDHLVLERAEPIVEGAVDGSGSP